MGNCFRNHEHNGTCKNHQLGIAEEIMSVKVILPVIGLENSGKHTLLKQIRLFYSEEGEFSSGERTAYKKEIYRNILNGFLFLLKEF